MVGAMRFQAGFFLHLTVLSFLAAAQGAQLAESMRLAASGDLERARNLLIQLKQSHPGDPEIRYRLGLVLLRQRNFQQAESELEAAARLKPDSPMVWLGLAQVRLQLGRAEQGLEAASRAAELAGGDPAVSRALAMLNAQAAEFYSGSAKALRLKKEPARAVEHFQLAIRLNPDQPSYYAELATLFLDHRTPEPAAAVLDAAVARFPKDAELHRLLGLARYAAGDSQRALDAFLAAIELAPDSELMYVSLETLLPEAGSRMDQIVARLRRYAQKNPSSPVGHYLLALSNGSGNDAETEALLRKAIASDAAFWPAWYELHKLLLARDQLAQASEALEKVGSLNPNHAPSHYSLAQIYARLGNRDRSRKHRQIHHQLISAEREAAEARRAQSPRLPYTLGKP
jgi:tetratricopeptide (TPR) repeat protein